jgi:hypothetical protein
MGTDNVISFDEVLKAEIRRELTDVMGARGLDPELEAILESWGNITMNDHQVLAALHKLKRPDVGT